MVAEDKQDRYLDNLCRSWTDALDDFYYIPVDTGLEMGVDNICREIIHQLKVEPEKLADYDLLYCRRRIVYKCLQKNND